MPGATRGVTTLDEVMLAYATQITLVTKQPNLKLKTWPFSPVSLFPPRTNFLAYFAAASITKEKKVS
jgi:hypothetical protein